VTLLTLQRQQHVPSLQPVVSNTHHSDSTHRSIVAVVVAAAAHIDSVHGLEFLPSGLDHQ
jgi:hypothetical protein